MKKQYEVQIFYSGFFSYQIEADNESEAIRQARIIPVKQSELITSLENRKDADTGIEIKDD